MGGRAAPVHEGAELFPGYRLPGGTGQLPGGACFLFLFLGAPCALAMLGRIRFTARFLNRHCCPRSVFIFGRAPGHKKVVRDTRRRCALPLQCPNMSIPRPSMDKSTLSPRQRTRKNRRIKRRLSKKSQKTIDGLTTIYCVYFRKIIE